MKSVEARVADLENAFAEVAKAKGIVGADGKDGHDGRDGARGPAGDIHAASENARLATREEFAIVKTLMERGIAQVAASHKAAEQDRLAFRESLENEIAQIVVKVLREYHIIDETNTPTHWGKP